jgi:hypothetical protein
MALARPYRVEYYRNRRGKAEVVKVGHAASITGALRAAVKTIQGEQQARWCQVLNDKGIVKAYMESRLMHPRGRSNCYLFKIETF